MQVARECKCSHGVESEGRLDGVGAHRLSAKHAASVINEDIKRCGTLQHLVSQARNVLQRQQISGEELTGSSDPRQLLDDRRTTCLVATYHQHTCASPCHCNGSCLPNPRRCTRNQHSFAGEVDHHPLLLAPVATACRFTKSTTTCIDLDES